MHTQAKKIETFCKWAGLHVNIDGKRKNKTAWTGIVRDGNPGELVALEGAKAYGPTLLREEGNPIPYLQPHESYTYLVGLSINLRLRWGEHWAGKGV
eukprot:5051018-Pyramimonas_sp.AAC.1